MIVLRRRLMLGCSFWVGRSRGDPIARMVRFWLGCPRPSERMVAPPSQAVHSMDATGAPEVTHGAGIVFDESARGAGHAPP
ncbi:hypothetical protein ASE03_32710 [Kitasatospora sp. Root187]|nr:hypothetical protein ASC99_17665 [Kitasatospora sp. Root107]KRB64584.1 hypothetical protein ASE03_32710 [Kitasatospora sp. Root187]